MAAFSVIQDGRPPGPARTFAYVAARCAKAVLSPLKLTLCTLSVTATAITCRPHSTLFPLAQLRLHSLGRCPVYPALALALIGPRIALFEACSAFTHVAAYTLAEPLNGPLTSECSCDDNTPRRSDCYRLERPNCRVGLTPTESRRSSRRTESLGYCRASLRDVLAAADLCRTTRATP